VVEMHVDATHMRTFLLTLAVMLIIPATFLYAQRTSKNAVDTTEHIPEPDEFVQFDQEPKFDEAELYLRLKYPEEARKNNIEGSVIIQVFVSREGKVLQTRILRYQGSSDNPLLEEAALNAVKQTTFTPAIQGGQPISMWWPIPIKFLLN
jgi:protein TonB